MRKIVFCRENAQLGNRLIVYAHLLAAARERGWELVNPTFETYADLFTGTRSRPHGRSLRAVRAAWQAGKILAPLSAGFIARARARGEVEVDLEATVGAAERRGSKWLLIQGYRIRCPNWAAKQADYVRDFFTPIADYRTAAEQRIAALRAQADVVVGIHIRHGDYAQHLGGRFFYDFAQYAGFMRTMRNNLAPRTIAFVICTHVPLPSEIFAEFTWAAGPGEIASDLHALSLCDYILGPPSSYSAWAAFHGAVPLMHLERAEANFGLDQFRPPTYPEMLF